MPSAFVAVPIGMLANLIVGGFWYSPSGFGGRMWADKKPTAKQSHAMGLRHFVGILVVALIEVYGLLQVVQVVRAAGFVEGVFYGYLCWQFFVMPTMGVHYVFNGRSLEEFAINCGYHLAGFTVECGLMALLK